MFLVYLRLERQLVFVPLILDVLCLHIVMFLLFLVEVVEDVPFLLGPLPQFGRLILRLQLGVESAFLLLFGLLGCLLDYSLSRIVPVFSFLGKVEGLFV